MRIWLSENMFTSLH